MRAEEVAINSGGESWLKAGWRSHTQGTFPVEATNAHGTRFRGGFGMERYMKPHHARSAVRWFFFLFSVDALVLAASLLILEAIIVSP